MYAILSVICYLASATLLARDLNASRPPCVPARLLALAALLLHAFELYHSAWQMNAINVTLFNVLSASGWMTSLVLVVLSVRRNILTPAVIIFPGTVVWIIAAALWPLPPIVIEGYSTSLSVHIFSSLLAYGVFATAALHAIVLTVQERLLRRHMQRPWMRSLPPLTASEQLMFRIIGVGWILLSISLLSGFLFVEDLFAQHLAHKTFLSIVSWLVFSALLVGRWRRGWRGLLALYWTLAGVLILLLAYFGSKLVLELMLNSGWQS
ncbi:MAG: cytochrome c biogenesis protein CcsA [Xanthomonadales bacterium]|nr:cytochrome c biogenesis protein CcsA [Xanthomonadales bacterium]